MAVCLSLSTPARLELSWIFQPRIHNRIRYSAGSDSLPKDNAWFRHGEAISMPPSTVTQLTIVQAILSHFLAFSCWCIISIHDVTTKKPHQRAAFKHVLCAYTFLVAFGLVKPKSALMLETLACESPVSMHITAQAEQHASQAKDVNASAAAANEIAASQNRTAAAAAANQNEANELLVNYTNSSNALLQTQEDRDRVEAAKRAVFDQ